MSSDRIIHGGPNLLKSLGFDLKTKTDMSVLVDRKQRLELNLYRFRVLAVIVKIGQLSQLFNYHDCKEKFDHFEVGSVEANQFINCIQMPCIFDYHYVNDIRLYRGCGKSCRRKYFNYN